MLKDSYLLQIMYFPNMVANSNIFLTMIVFVYVTVLSVFCAENCNLVKWASWPPTTVKSLTDDSL